MNIKVRRPKQPFDFGDAITQPFRSPDGTSFVWRLVLWMTAGLMLIYIVTMPFILPYYGALMEQSWLSMQSTLNQTEPPDPSQILAIYAKIAPAYVVMLLGMWVVLVSGEVAMHRKILLNEENPKRPLRFGKAELRVILAQLGVWGLWFLAYLVFITFITAVTALLAVVVPALGVILVVVGAIAIICLLVWLPIRLAPAAALTINQDKRHLLAARNVTKYRFWNLFLAYLVVGVLGYIFIYALMFILLMIFTGDPNIMMAMSGFGQENPRDIFNAFAARFKNPIFLVIGLLIMAAYTALVSLWLLCFAGVGTYAVKWWKAEDVSPHFD